MCRLPALLIPCSRRASPLWYGVGVSPAAAPTSLRFRNRRHPKNSFTLKITDEDGDPRKVSVLGLPAESDWVLYAPYPDKTLMRDVLAYEISSRMGQWAPRTRFVEVFVNQTGTRLSRRDYVGVYALVEII